MGTAVIESASEYRAALSRIAAIEEYAEQLAGALALARAYRALGRVGDADLRDVAAVDECLDDIAFALRDLRRAVAEWEAFAHPDPRGGGPS